MSRWVCLMRCVIGMMICGLALPASAEHHERKRTERAEILTLEGRWRQAQLGEDTAAMDKLLSDQFLGITASGQVVTKMQQLDRMRTRSLDITRMEVADTKIKITGNVAVVTSLANIEGLADGTPLHGAFRYTRVYQRVPGDGWKITNFEATRVHPPASALSPQASSGGPPAGVPNSHRAFPVRFGFPQPQS